ncbi:YTH domain-containing protein ECT4-like [Gastrolobium bilobum]|uniref:YTH domain-containing protein ECT4-like n=1 Tax=Gastrolobium bilobum TaxID=150636 RepID=UPI002AB328EC|nr:YTH domain-containing protein ECT4-like [Gastrolobium bilobum]XP_061376015.1 YTH domain-containing protein ECT4-like [Gastrolobium bilobum]
MSCDKEFEKTQSVPTGTTGSSQPQNEADEVSVKNCISSDLTSSVTSTGDVAAGFAGVDVHCVDQQPYLSSTGYFQQPGLHESEVLPCSSVSTSFGVQNETVNGSVIAKNDPKCSGFAKPNSLNSTNRNGNLTSALSKTVADTKKDIKTLNKAPHLHSNFTAASLPRTYDQMGKFSSLANPRHNVFPPTNRRPYASITYGPNASTNYRPNASTNYQPNGRVSSVNDRFLLSDKFRSGQSEMSMEMTRGPRGHYSNFPLKSSSVKEEFAITICRDRYNLSDFQTEYETAKFYVIKSFNEDDIHKCIKYDVWTSTPSGNKKLNSAFLDAEAKLGQTGTKCPVFLFFSVNASRQFVGVAEMFGPVDFNKDMKFWKLDKYNGFFPVKWHIIKDVPNNRLQHIILQNNENKSVTYTRDTQEIGLKEGLEMLNIFKSYPAKTSLLDDFDFYEKREKLFCSQRSTKHTSPEQEEVYGNDNHQNTVQAREKKIDMQSSGTKQVTLVKLTENLSLNPSEKQGFPTTRLQDDQKLERKDS